MQYQITSLSFFKPKRKSIMMHASSILGCSKTVVKKKIPHHIINFIPDPLNSNKELMEIRLKDVTVTYVINNRDICCSGYLFLDDASNLEKYLNICNRYFKIITQNSWKYKNCYIEFLKEGPDLYFLFRN